MTNPSPEKVAIEIPEAVSELLFHIGHYIPSDDPRIIGWIDDLTKAMPAGRAEAFLAMAVVSHITGDIDRAVRFFERAETAGAPRQWLARLRCAVYQNLGFFTEAVIHGRQAFSIEVHNVGMGLPIVAAAGGFGFVAELLEQARLGQVDLGYVEQIEEIRQIAQFAQSNDIPDERFSAVLDIAGSLMRERQLIWLDDAPQLSFDEEMDCPGVRWRVDMSPEDATDMSFKFIERLVAADLDSVPLTVGFIGSRADEMEEAN
ncbi:hypothetical protein NF681_11290 [Comamonadaceae bacterium OTU4NAUVB1]|nr:hypothetical protein NF681_11290 [Comamonadaceae bacterium OTU4NAUVB1]